MSRTITHNSNVERRAMGANGGSAWLAKSILCCWRKDLGTNGLAVYCELAGRIDGRNPMQECSVYQRSIASVLGLSLKTVKRNLWRCKQLGLIDVIPPEKHGQPSTYAFLNVDHKASCPRRRNADGGGDRAVTPHGDRAVTPPPPEGGDKAVTPVLRTVQNSKNGELRTVPQGPSSQARPEAPSVALIVASPDEDEREQKAIEYGKWLKGVTRGGDIVIQ